MACYQFPHQQLHFWRSFCFFRNNLSINQRICSTLLTSRYSSRAYSSSILAKKDLRRVCCRLNPVSSSSISTATETAATVSPGAYIDSSIQKDGPASTSSSKGRVMLIDGTSIFYRAYYKLLAKLHHGHLIHADGNGDWVLTIFTAMSLILDVLEFTPSHVAVVFDHDGVPYGPAPLSSKQNFVAKGMNFRHTLYPAYKGRLHQIQSFRDFNT